MKKIILLLLLLKSTFLLSQTVGFDPTFGNNGKTHTGFGASNAQARAVVTQPDGKIIVAGSAYSANPKNLYRTDTNNAVLIRYNSDGTIDTTFGNEGIVTYNYNVIYNSNQINSGVDKLVLQPDGKILALIGAGSPSFVRFNTNGSIDTSYGNNGTLIFTTVFSSFAFQPDSKIITAYKQDHYNTFGQVDSSYFRTERYNVDGTLDTTFGTNGTVLTDFGFGYNAVFAMTLQPDGKVLVAGDSFNDKFAIARYTTNGNLDTTFDGDGKVITSLGSGLKSYLKYVSVQADGKIIVAGVSYTSTATQEFYFSIAKYNTNGSLDTSFDGDGIVNNLFEFGPTETYVNVNTIIEQPDGKFLVTTEDPNNFEFVLRRYNANGSDDDSFGINGKSTLFPQDVNRAFGIALQQDQKIVVAGYSRSFSTFNEIEFDVVRYSTNGVPDVSFDNDGIIAQKFDSSNDLCAKLLIQPDDKIITVGIKKIVTINTVGKDFIAMSRTNTDGSLDSTFGTAGKVVSDLGQDYTIINNAVLQQDGKILVSCQTATFGNSFYDYFLIRYNNNGSLDTNFGTNGKIILTYVTAILPLPNGKIIIASQVSDAQVNPFLNLKRLNNDGSLDSTFNNNVLVNIDGFINGSIYSTLQSDGKIVVVASIPNQQGKTGFYKIRYNSDGTVDTSYANGLIFFENSSLVYGVFLRNDGKIYVTGKSGSYDLVNQIYSSEFLAACFDTNGNLDSNYGVNGVARSLLGNVYNIVQSVAMQPDGKFIVALTKPELNPANPTPETYNVVVSRFNSEGGNDADFGTNGAIETSFFDSYDEAFDVALQSDNMIVVACTTDTGANRDFGLIRFTNNALGNENFNINSSFNCILFPIPTQNALNIKFPENVSVNVNKIAIVNSLGQTVIEQSNKSNSNYNGIESIDVTYLQKGIYIVLLQTNYGNWNGKFVKE